MISNGGVLNSVGNQTKPCQAKNIIILHNYMSDNEKFIPLPELIKLRQKFEEEAEMLKYAAGNQLLHFGKSEEYQRLNGRVSGFESAAGYIEILENSDCVVEADIEAENQSSEKPDVVKEGESIYGTPQDSASPGVECGDGRQEKETP